MATENIPPVLIEFQADIKGISDALVRIEQQLKTFDGAAQKSTHEIKKVTHASITMGTFFGTTLTHMAGELYHFAKESVDKFSEVGNEVISMRRVIGGSAEQVSKLRFAGEELGVSTKQLTVGFRTLDKHLMKNDKSAQALGITYRDSKGKLLDNFNVLNKLADRFTHMSDGAAKTALATTAFGKAGMAMLPMLNQGSEGIKEMYDNAQKLGLVMSGKDLDLKKVWDFTQNQRELKATLEGIQITLSRNVMPVFMDFLDIMRGLTTSVGAAIHKHSGLFKILGAVTIGIITLYTATKTYRFIAGVTQIAVEGLTGAFRLLAGAEALAEWEILLIIAAVAALIAAFVYFYKHSKGFHDVVLKYVVYALKAGNYELQILASWIRYVIDGVSDFIIVFMKAAKFLEFLYPPLRILRQKTGKTWDEMGQDVLNFRNKSDKAINDLKDRASKNLAQITPHVGEFTDKLMNFSITKWLHGIASKYSIKLPGMGPEDGSGDSGGGTAEDPKKQKEAIQAMLDVVRQLDAKFQLAKANAHTIAQQKKVADYYLEQAKALVATAKAEEKKTRGTVNHTVAQNLLNKALAEQAKIQNYVNKVNDEAAKAASKAAQAQQALNNTLTSSQSWLAAHASGSITSNAGSITVPVMIDGREVFRAVQKQSTQNSRRNINNGLSFTGGSW